MNALEKLRMHAQKEARRSTARFSPAARTSLVPGADLPLWGAEPQAAHASASATSSGGLRSDPVRVMLHAYDAPHTTLSDARREQLLRALRLERIEHALLCVPSGYTDAREAVVRTAHVQDGVRELFLLRATGRMRVYDKAGRELSCAPYESWSQAPWVGYWSRFRRASIEFVDRAGCKLYTTVFSPSLAKDLGQAGEHLVAGELATFRARALQRPEVLPLAAVGRVYPSYASPGSTTSEEGVRALVLEALGMPDAALLCEQYLREQTLLSEREMLLLLRSVPCCEDLESVQDFLRRLHAPRSASEGDALRAAARRLAVVGLANAARIQSWRAPNPAARIDLPYERIRQIADALPMKLTRDQMSAIVEICDALRNDTPMNALLCADVGCGKTLAFAVPAVAAHLQGARVAIVAPTEILADQLAARLEEFFPQAQVQRVRAGGKTINESAILVGTIGLGSVAQKLGYVPNVLIVDEQHKLAVNARRMMAGPATHLLESSATPIPQALASTLYSGVQMITMRRSPIAREIRSMIAGPDDRAAISRRLRETIESGARAAIIYPRVNAAAAQEKASVERAAQDLEAVLPGRIAVLHGKMSDEAVQSELAAFRSGEKPLLIASTIVETGIDVPDIRLLIVREADRFGIAQLHQLRGRLCRNGGEGDFVMWVEDPDALSDDTRARLQALVDLTDGFALAEEDMKMRGFGDLLGEQQNGAITLPMRMLRLSTEDVEREVVNCVDDIEKFFESDESRDHAAEAVVA